ncbi:MAG: SAM-dependent methyltransferase [Ekhidna sp.]|nr:SAM-dependent methyltransferase [Ekhidna sp.]MBC6411287.1 SAM-dependent methyltransferase [Ekhidna sp.]MBC6426665.1 SAM-dependent methyltransferase [Ekhidna sp.]
MSNGKLFLIPTYLSSGNDASFIAPMVVDVITNCSYYFVENVRTARRFISSLKTGLVIEELNFSLLDKKSARDDFYPLFEPLKNGDDMALIAEAGLPCLADPGNAVVTFAHQTGIQVVPLPGASSVQMALTASGFNGQQFTFHGYLPIAKNPRKQKIRELESAAQAGYSQLFMETPYRNRQMFKTILETCRPDSLLSIASDISGPNEFILTQSIQKWKTTNIQIHKIPAIFSFGQFP